MRNVNSQPRLSQITSDDWSEAVCEATRTGRLSGAVGILLLFCTATSFALMYRFHDNSAEVVKPKEEVIMPQDAEKLILGDDFGAAQAALRRAISEKDRTTVETALKARSYTIKTDAAKSLADIGTVKSIPKLRDALLHHVVPGFGGTELQMDHRELVSKILIALSVLTGEDYGPVDSASPDAIQEAVTQTDKWISANYE